MSQGEMGSMVYQQNEDAPGLFTFLFDKYVEYCANNWEMAQHSSTMHFVNFCEDFLSRTENRPTNTFAAFQNVGVYLGSVQRVVIAPPINVGAGEMAPVVGADGKVVPNQGAVQITGNARKQSGMEDMSQYDRRTFEQAKGRTLPATVDKPAERLDQKGSFTRRRT